MIFGVVLLVFSCDFVCGQMGVYFSWSKLEPMLQCFRKYNVWMLWLSCCSLLACTNRPTGKLLVLKGKAQGTSYEVRYIDKSGADYQQSIDSLLAEMDTSFSTYVPESVISTFNKGDTLRTQDLHFIALLKLSEHLYKLTQGAFDPTVMPLVQAWGFGPDDRLTPQVEDLDSIQNMVGFDLLEMGAKGPDVYELRKAHKGMQLDFNAIAQGYSVDLIAALLEEADIQNYLVELGGEIRVLGKNEKGKAWRLGIEQPVEQEGTSGLSAIIELSAGALATSGSYKRYYEQDGIRYSHTIDPHLGHPVRHNLLSVSVVAPDCATADALATAYMVMGLENALQLLSEHPELEAEAYFISSEKNGQFSTYVTPGMQHMLLE